MRCLGLLAVCMLLASGCHNTEKRTTKALALVDSTAPTISLISAPANLSLSATAQFLFAPGDSGGTGLTTICKLDAQAAAPCTSPYVLTGLSNGAHRVELTARDGAGNVSVAVSHAWTVNAPPANFPWPLLYGQAGSYALASNDDVKDMADLGLHLHITNDNYRDGMRANGSKYIGVDPAYFIYSKLCPDFVCNVTPEKEQQLLDQIRSYLQAQQNNPQLVGYWILDDYPDSGNNGDIRGTVEKVHALVVEANRTSVVKRPTICGFGCTLDLAADIGPSSDECLDKALTNFTPTGCDVVAFYPYAVSHNPAIGTFQTDWRMNRLLTHFFEGLTAKGWNRATTPLIAMPHAFASSTEPGGGYLFPEPDHMVLQATSYCNAGFSALIGFTWKAGVTPYELHNNEKLRQGFLGGIKSCKSIWYP